MCDYMIRVSQWLKECQMLRDMAKSNLDFSLLLKLEWILGFSGMLKNIIFRVEWEWGPVCLSQKFKNRRKIVWMLGMVLGMKLFPNKKGFRISSKPLILLWRERRDLNSRPPAWQAGVLTKLNYAPEFFYFLLSTTTGEKWWAEQGLNLWPTACKAAALPTELPALIQYNSQVIENALSNSNIYLCQDKSVTQSFGDQSILPLPWNALEGKYPCQMRSWFSKWRLAASSGGR